MLCVTAGGTCGTALCFEESHGLVHVCMDTDTFEGTPFWHPVKQRADGKVEERLLAAPPCFPDQESPAERSQRLTHLVHQNLAELWNTVGP